MAREKPKLLVLLSRFPYPLDKGDKLRAFNQLKGLSNRFNIILVCLSTQQVPQSSIDQVSPFCEKVEVIKLSYIGIARRLILGLFGQLPFQVLYFHSPKAQKRVDEIIEEHTPRRFFVQLIRVSEYTVKYTIFKKTLDYMDALSIGMNRRLKKSPFYLKPFVKEEYKRLIKYENKMFKHFDHKIIISDQDKEYIAHQNTDEIEVIANGIDFNYWTPSPSNKKYDVLFTGNMGYPPNIEGAQYIVNEILPILMKSRPTIQILICGKSPSGAVKSLANKNVTVSGWVPDIRDAYNSSRVFLAPMNLGSGLQNKLLEAMSMEIPCVTSVLANKALGAQPRSQILIGESPEEYANHVISLLDNSNQGKEITINAKSFVKENFDWDYWNNKLAGIMLDKN